jgi:hypothetical protein
MHKDIKTYTNEEQGHFAITSYMSATIGKLEAHADGIVKYQQSLGPKYFSEELKKVIDSLYAVRAKLSENQAWDIQLKKKSQ